MKRHKTMGEYKGDLPDIDLTKIHRFAHIGEYEYTAKKAKKNMLLIDTFETTNKSIDDIDAMIFSGDSLHDQETLNRFKKIIKRWKRGMKEAQSLIDDMVNDDD